MESLFVPNGHGGFESTALTGGPWRPDAQHGGPPASLLAHLVESVAESTERVARISVELVRPVPLTTLTTTVDREAVSRRVAHASASLLDGDAVVATARALLLATAELPDPGWRPIEEAGEPQEATPLDPPSWASGDTIAFHRHALEHRVIVGGFETPGPAVDWIRLRQPVIAGVTTSPLMRVAAAADIASGISSVYDFTAGVGLINADLTIALHRSLRGEWVGIDAVTRVGPDGIGLCTTRLFDVDGTIGSSTQSLIGLTIKTP